MRSLREKTESSQFNKVFDERLVHNYFKKTKIDKKYDKNICFERIINLSQFELTTKYMTMYYLGKPADKIFYSAISGACNIDDLFCNNGGSVEYISQFINDFYDEQNLENYSEECLANKKIMYGSMISTYEIFNRSKNTYFQSPKTFQQYLYNRYFSMVREVVNRNLSFVENFLPGIDFYKIGQFNVTDSYGESLKCCTRCSISMDMSKLFMVLSTQNAPTALDVVELFVDYYYLLQRNIEDYQSVKELVLVCPLTNSVYIHDVNKNYEELGDYNGSVVDFVIEQYMNCDKAEHGDDKNLPSSMIYGDFNALYSELSHTIERFIFKYHLLSKCVTEMFYTLRNNHFTYVNVGDYNNFQKLTDVLKYNDNTHDKQLNRLKVNFSELNAINRMRNYVCHTCYIDLKNNISHINYYNQAVIFLQTIKETEELLDKNLKRIQKIPGDSLNKIVSYYNESLEHEFYKNIYEFNRVTGADIQFVEMYVKILASRLNNTTIESKLFYNNFVEISQSLKVIAALNIITDEEAKTVQKALVVRNYCYHHAIQNILTYGVYDSMCENEARLDNMLKVDLITEAKNILLNAYLRINEAEHYETDTTKESTTLN